MRRSLYLAICSALCPLVWACGGGTVTRAVPPAAPADTTSGSTPTGEATGARSAPEATRVRPAVERLLAHSGIESIVGDRAGGFTRQVAYMAGDLTDDELERLVPAVQSAFAPELLARDVVDVLVREAPGEGTVARLLEWQERGANAELERIAESYEPPLDLSEYALSLIHI